MKKIILLIFCLLIIPKLAFAGSFCSGAGKSVNGSAKAAGGGHRLKAVAHPLCAAATDRGSTVLLRASG